MDAQSSWTATDHLDSFDCTLANLGEIVLETLEAANVRSVAEIGAENGLFTQELLGWAERAGVERISAIDPAPRERLLELARTCPELELIVGTSHDVLPRLELPDAVIIDGDHNYFTVREELRLIAERSGGELPLLLVHDIGWPLARRDSYHDPERIPAGNRRPLAHDAFLVPGVAGVADRGLYYECAAATEGGPHNGVLTAVEDFLAGDADLRLAIVPPFFGLGVVWHRDAPWAPAVEQSLAPWDRNPVLERVEAKRVAHLVAEYESLQAIDAMRSEDYELQLLLTMMLHSKAFAIAERVSRLRQGGRPMFSREQVESALARVQADNDLIGAVGPASANGAQAESDDAPAGGRPPAPAPGITETAAGAS